MREENLFPGKVRETKYHYLDYRDVSWLHRLVCLPLCIPLSFLILSEAAFSVMTWIYCNLVQNPKEQHMHQSQCVHITAEYTISQQSVKWLLIQKVGAVSLLVINILSYSRTAYIKSASNRMLLCLEQCLTWIIFIWKWDFNYESKN